MIVVKQIITKNSKITFSFITILILLVFSTTTVLASPSTSKFSIKYEKGKVVMSNFDADIDKYKPCPIKYVATGKKNVKDIDITVKKGQVAIVGGYSLFDLNASFYGIVGPGRYVFNITDGFIEIVDQKKAAKEWQYRLYLVQKNNWKITYFFGEDLVK